MATKDQQAPKARERRLELIREIQKERQSKVIVYITGDRRNAEALIATDALRPMYEHLLLWDQEELRRVDMFLYSRGGYVDAPWPLVTMFRESCKRFSVLIPHRAHSAATLIALGADQVCMGSKGELGPIDPIVHWEEGGERRSTSVENVMAFIDFLKDRAGLTDQSALSGAIGLLIEGFTPWRLGDAYRIHSHTRMVARKLLTTHEEPLEERQIDLITETLAERMYFHGHAIGRGEAKELGLPIIDAPDCVDSLMWDLFVQYEKLLELNRPVDPRGFAMSNEEERKDPIITACIESENRLDVYRGTLWLKNRREMPPQLQLNVNAGINLPAGIDASAIPEQARVQLASVKQQLRAFVAQLVQEQITIQAPVVGTSKHLVNMAWEIATEEGI